MFLRQPATSVAPNRGRALALTVIVSALAPVAAGGDFGKKQAPGAGFRDSRPVAGLPPTTTAGRPIPSVVVHQLRPVDITAVGEGSLTTLFASNNGFRRELVRPHRQDRPDRGRFRS